MRLIITAEVEAKLNAYVMAVDTEIAGMGKVKVSDAGDIMLLDVAIYDQVVTGGTADLSTEALAKFQTELIKAGESPEDWVLWWHSHAGMQAFFSGTDTSTIESSTEYQYLVSLVVNRRRERKARLDLYHPFRFTQDNLAIIVGTANEVIPEEIRAEVEAKVKVKTYSWEKKDGVYGEHRTAPGFGKHKLLHEQTEHGGKGYPANSDDDYDAMTSGLGLPRIIRADDPTSLDRDEILTIIDVLEDQIQQHKNNGTTSSDECREMQEDLIDWKYELAARGGDPLDELAESYINFNEGK